MASTVFSKPVDTEISDLNRYVHSGTLPNNTDLNDVTDSGNYFLNSSYTYSNTPSSTIYILNVDKGSSDSNTIIQYGYGSSSNFFRFKTGATTWGAWHEIVSGGALDSAVVHNTGNEDINGDKTFKDKLYVKNSTTTPNILLFGSDMSSPSGGIFVQNAEVDGSKFGRTYFQFREVSPTSAGANTGYEERFNLPAAAYDLTETKSYNILTTRSAVSIAQGGTGVTAVASTTASGKGLTATFKRWGKLCTVYIDGTTTSAVTADTSILTIPTACKPAVTFDVLGFVGAWTYSSTMSFRFNGTSFTCHSAISSGKYVSVSATYTIE